MARALAQEIEERLIGFAVIGCRVADRLPRSPAAFQIARQLARCVTSPAANYAEAQAAGSRRDFVHKMRICLKELQESYVWLRLARERHPRDTVIIGRALEECNELIAIFVASVKTAEGGDGGSVSQ